MRLIIFLFGLYLLVSSCDLSRKKKIIENEVNSRLDSTLLHINEYPIYNVDTIKNCVGKKFEFVVSIDGTCPLCITFLEQWTVLQKEWEEYDVGYKFIIYTYDIDVVKKLLQEIEFKDNVYLDFEDLFKKSNNISSTKLLQTFLINSNERIVRIGDPTLSSNVKNMYEKLFYEDWLINVNQTSKK